MRIALEARALTRPASGIRTYVEHLVAGLRHTQTDHEYRILDHGPRSEVLWPLWLNTTVPRWLREQQPSVVHFTKSAVPRRKLFPTVVTIYDVIPILFPESQKIVPRWLWPQVLQHAAETADHIVTISEASRRDIVEQLQVSEKKVTVTPLAVNPKLETQIAKTSASMEQPPYILFLGTIEPRKNVPALVRSFAKIAKHIPHRLVIAGRAYKGLDDVKEEIREAKLEGRIELRDFVPHEELPTLYARADLFVWPSIYEGWGFPPQEAMSYGVPVIVSNGGSLPEVVGRAGEVVPFTVGPVAERTGDEVFEVALADRMRAVLTDSAKRATMKTAGFEHVQKNSWEHVVSTTQGVYESVFASR